MTNVPFVTFYIDLAVIVKVEGHNNTKIESAQVKRSLYLI